MGSQVLREEMAWFRCPQARQLPRCTEHHYVGRKTRVPDYKSTARYISKHMGCKSGYCPCRAISACSLSGIPSSKFLSFLSIPPVNGCFPTQKELFSNRSKGCFMNKTFLLPLMNSVVV
jgi:hypothetical protein